MTDVLAPFPERRRGFPLSRQLKVVVPLLVVWAAGLGLLLTVAPLRDHGKMLVDASYASGGRWYYGIISQLGLLAWCASTATAAWTGWMAKIWGRRGAAVFLRQGAYISGALLIDDLFDIHAVATNGRFQKVAAMLILGGMVAAWFAKNWQEIRRTRHFVMIAGLAANGVSILIDTLFHPGIENNMLLLEDGAKFLGILAWATYFVITCTEISRSVLAASRLPSAMPMARRQSAPVAPSSAQPMPQPTLRRHAAAVG